MPRRPRRALAALAAVALVHAAAAEEGSKPVVEAGRKVSIEYTLRLEDGTVVHTNAGGEPFVYEHGSGALLPGLEAALAGAALGETRQGTLPAEAAYGAIRPEFYSEVEASRIPEQDRRVGAELDYRDSEGEPLRVRVYEVRGDRIVIDFNHPLAGHAIRYEVKVVAIQ
jgi:FKBP-type peptidyl-prolyl cis-trans isomerase 2